MIPSRKIGLFSLNSFGSENFLILLCKNVMKKTKRLFFVHKWSEFGVNFQCAYEMSEMYKTEIKFMQGEQQGRRT